MGWYADTYTAAPRPRCRFPASRLRLLTTSNLSVRGVLRWWQEMRAAPMRRILVGFTGVLAACGTPAYRASEVPVPETYSVPTPTTVTSPAQVAGAPGSEKVDRSAGVASTPLGDAIAGTTLISLGREAQRANMDVRIAEARLTGARAVHKLAS